MKFRNPQQAFTDAIAEDLLSANPHASNYAGEYMYMGTECGRDAFKHRKTRLYCYSTEQHQPVFFDTWPGEFTVHGIDDPAAGPRDRGR